MAFVRPYTSADEDAVIHIFRETAAPELRADKDPDVLHIGSYIWARPYIYLYPDWCFVVDNGYGNAVGYILCAPDTADFVNEYKEKFIQIVESADIARPAQATNKTGQVTWLRQTVYGPENLLQTNYPGLLDGYPAHLHIDILPSHQGQQWGPRLMDVLFAKLRDANVPGIHLGMAAANEGAGRFYTRIGFKPFEGMNQYGQQGRNGGAIYFVRKTNT